MSEFLKVFLLGIVEGITEWLPISSTGHMILVEEFIQLNVSADFMEMFRVVIQLGAILAVVLLYFPKLWPLVRGRFWLPLRLILGSIYAKGRVCPLSIDICLTATGSYRICTCFPKQASFYHNPFWKLRQ